MADENSSLLGMHARLLAEERFGAGTKPKHVMEELGEWLASFEKKLKARRWRNATHILCMLGVEQPAVFNTEPFESGFSVLYWLARNRSAWNQMVLDVLNKYPESKEKILNYVLLDIGRLSVGLEPECFAILDHAKWMVGYLKQ